MQAPPRTEGRDPGIDSFRGLAIVMMVIANYLEHIRVVPGWLKHAPDVGITVIDFIAPFFIFAIGLTFGASVRRRREREGWQRCIEHTVRRAMALAGIGALFSLGELGFGFNPGGYPWGTLQAIGVAILLGFPFLFLPWPARLAAGLALLAGYQLLVDRVWLARVIAAPQAGLPGTLSWAVLLILATTFADLSTGGKGASYLALALLLLAAGIALSPLIPVSKHRMSLSFDLIVTGTGALVSAAFRLSRAARLRAMRVLAVWGTNPLLLYVTHLVLLAVFLVPAAPRWHVEAPVWQAALQGAAFVALLQALAWWLHRRRIVVSL